jgi:ATP-binding cassette, subfamily B, bacterial MsbA
MGDWSTVKDLRRLLKFVGMKPAFFIVPGILSILAAAFEGLSLALLVPIAQSVFTRDYEGVRAIPLLQKFLSYLPESMSSSYGRLLFVLLVLFSAAIVMKILLRYFSMLSMCFLSFRTAHHLRKQIFTRYLTFGKLFFDRSTIGHHATVLSTFSEQAMVPFISFDRFANNIFSLIMYLVVMSNISWQLTLYALPLFLLLHMSVTFLIRRIRVLSGQAAEIGKSLQQKSMEILSTIPLVIAYNAQQHEKNHYTKISDRLARQWMRIASMNYAINPMNEMETLGAIISLLLLIFFVLPQGSLDGSAMVVYFYLVLNSAIRFSALVNFRAVIAQASGPITQILELFHDRDKFYVSSGDKEFRGVKDKIEFRHLHYQYSKGRDVLEDINFSIEKNKMTAIVGPTGSGKSTLINLLMRYYEVEPGMIFIDGTDIRNYTLESVRSHMALVSQDTQLLNDSIRNNISYGFEEVPDHRLRDVIDQAALTPLIQKLPNGLDTLIGDRGVQLSGGEKQRVSIARALLKNADILILDEATSSLDSQTEALIQEAIDHVTKGKTAIVIAHRLSTIRNADHIVVLEHGKCIEQGPLTELMEKKGRFHQYWEAQRFS